LQQNPLHIVHTESSLGWGGQEIRILNEAQGMIRRGHRVTILCPSHARIYEEANTRGVPAVALPIARKKLSGAVSMYKWLKTHDTDIVNTHSSTDSWLVALANLFLPNRVPIVRTRHISAPIRKNMATSWLYKKSAAHIVTTGEALAQQLNQANDIPLENLTSVPTGIDTQLFVPGDKESARGKLVLPLDRKIIGIAATLRSWKGHRYLMEAFAQIKDKNAMLLIVGDGPGRENLQAQAEQLGIKERVIMPGNQRDVVPWLQSMDIFVLPSYANEGVPQAILQAGFCKIPVITTTAGAIPEISRHEDTALIVPMQQVAPLTRAIERLLDDEALADKIKNNAYQFVSARFGLDIMLDKMEKIFFKAVNGHSVR
jgi:glycosyltransferase involved in cell wall biosynthesis